jgi:hypothetical protein
MMVLATTQVGNFMNMVIGHEWWIVKNNFSLLLEEKNRNKKGEGA